MRRTRRLASIFWAFPVLGLLGCAPEPATPPPPDSKPAEAVATPSGAASSAPVVTATPPAPPPPTGVARAAEPVPTPPTSSFTSAVSRATTSEAPILSKITQDDILAAVNKNGDAFGACYALAAGPTKTVHMKVTVKASVGPTGVVNQVEIVSSTSKNPKVDACVSDAFKKITFNRAPGSGATVFTFPLSMDGGQAN